MTSVMSHMSQLRMITFQSLSEAAVSSRCVLAGAPAAALPSAASSANAFWLAAETLRHDARILF